MTRLRLTVIMLLVAMGCQRSPLSTQTDLRAYLAHTKAWAPVEAETVRTIRRILRTQFVDEAEVSRQIADSRPRVLAHLDRVRAYTPHSKDVRLIHGRYIAAWEVLMAGYDAILEGFSSGDHTKLARGRHAIEAWQEEIVAVARSLRELMRHVGIEADSAVESRTTDTDAPTASPKGWMPPSDAVAKQVERRGGPGVTGTDLRKELIRRRPTLPHGDRAVPSALEGLTAVFGMGTGVSPPLSPPETGSRNPSTSGRTITSLRASEW